MHTRTLDFRHMTIRSFLTAALGLCLAVPAEAQNPPRRLDFSQDSVAPPARDTVVRAPRLTTAEMRTVFVRNQSVLGLTAYGPAFAAMIGTEPATRIAAYMVMAGGTFFAANELTRQIHISPAREVLSSRMGWRGTISGFSMAMASDMPSGEAGALTLIGGLGGSAIGLALGGGLTEGEAVATVVGHDILVLSSLAMTYIADANDTDGTGLSPQARVAIPMVAGWGGYALGRLYAGRAPYEVTAGDALLLWLGAGVGGLAGSTVIAESSPSNQAVAGALLVGGLAGVWAADRFIVRRYDHTRSEGALVALGAGAGSLMGIGIGVLISGDADRTSGPTLAFATLGAIGGIMLAERSAQPAVDGGRRMEVGQGPLSRLQVDPMAAFAAATRAPGQHAIVRFTF
jgi:hypothetical protein